MTLALHHVAAAFTLTLICSPVTLGSKLKVERTGNSQTNDTGNGQTNNTGNGQTNNAKIPKILWVTGRWTKNNESALTKAYKNLELATSFADQSSWSQLGGQEKAEQAFMAWAPPGTVVRYNDNAAMEASVREISAQLESIGVHNVSKAFFNLRAGSFRADLWRLLILWSQGGVYVDANLIFRKKLSEFIDFEKDQVVMVADEGIPKQCREHGIAFWNAMIAATPRSEYMLAAIKALVHNIERHTYDWCDMTAVTGPTALGNAIGAMPNFRKDIKITWNWINPFVRLIGDDRYWLCQKDEELHEYNSDKHYHNLWSKRSIYCDENGPPGALC